MKTENTTTSQTQSDWLKVGTVVMVQHWVGIIHDIAFTANGVCMVQIKSPKGVWLNQRPEWLQFMPEHIWPATKAELDKDITTYRKRIEGMLSEIDKMESEWAIHELEKQLA